jgi:hypothetical protein
MSRVTFVASAGVRLALAAGILIASLAPGKAEPFYFGGGQCL